MQEILKNETNLKLSIIIPVYNTEKYVGECLDSCLAQDISENEYEIICVDDGSTDDSLKVLNEYSEKCSNIHVITQKNQGVSVARNVGISIARGKYIWFVDSDDYIEFNCLNMLLLSMNKYNAETCIFKRQATIYGIENMTSINIKGMKMAKHRKTSMFVTNTIFSRDILINNEIKFPINMQHGEDTYFSYVYSMFAHFSKMLLIDGVLYWYRHRDGSALHTKTFEELSKRIRSHINMALAYRKIQDKFTNMSVIDTTAYNELKGRIPMAVSAAMFTASGKIMKDYDINSMLIELKELNLYPYKLQWKSLILSYGWKPTVINWIRFLFPYEPYYKLYTHIVRSFH